MRTQDLKVQAIARELGMLYKPVGENREFSRPLRVNGLEMSFSYENPEDCAHVEVTQDQRPYKTVRLFRDNELDLELIKKEFPQFLN